MSGESIQAEKLIDEYMKNYMEKLYYFCLKKTGNGYEAEDLASDISLNILASLKKGTVPLQFSAWVWSIARNRYYAWAQAKRKRGNLICTDNFADNLLAAQERMDNDVIGEEMLSSLRRELAFISSNYRKVLIAFYIDDRSVKDIASSLHLPEGTVKSQLFRSRQQLKEGIGMAREFGEKSYNPADVSFAASGSQPGGLPWSAVSRKIPKNILLAASNHPLSLEELAVELGVAVPYMEEEAGLLLQATLLKQIGNQYVTGFFILDKEIQMAMYSAQRENAKERSEWIDRMISDSMPAIKELNLVRNNMSDNDLKWWLVIHAVDFCITELDGYQIEWPEKRENGESWGFIGFEKSDLPENCSMGHNGNGTERGMFWAYKIGDYGMWDRAGEMKYMEVLLLADLIRNHRKIDSLTDSERNIWQTIEHRFAHIDDNGTIIPDILVAEEGALGKLYALFRKHPLFDTIMENIQSAFDKTIELLKGAGSEVLYRQLSYAASMQILNIRMMMVHDEVESGRLLVPPEPQKSTVAMYMEMKR